MKIFRISLLAKPVGVLSIALSLLAASGSAFATLISTDVTYSMLHGTFRIYNTAVTSVSSGTFSGNSANVGAGATVTLTGSWALGPVIDDSYCPTCIIQEYIAWMLPAKTNGATPTNLGLWSGLSYDGGQTGPTSGTFIFITNAPTVTGEYFLGRGQTLDYSFKPWATGGTGRDTASGVTDYASFGINVVPEPGTMALLGLGLAGLGFSRRKRLV